VTIDGVQGVARVELTNGAEGWLFGTLHLAHAGIDPGDVVEGEFVAMTWGRP
jgi:hypothetical protein